MMILLAAVVGILLCSSAGLFVAFLLGSREPEVPKPPRRRVVTKTGIAADDTRRRPLLWITGAVVGGLAIFVISGWLIAGIAAGLAIWFAPKLIARGESKARIQRLEALEDWSRRLASTISAYAGLEDALTSSAAIAPAPIEREVRLLSERLARHWDAEAALRAFADDLDDPIGDFIAAALVLAARGRGRGLSEVLEGLANTVSEEASMRRRIDAEQASPRRNLKYTLLVAGLLFGGAALFGRGYFQVYQTAFGQVMLLGLMVGMAGCVWWMRRLATPPKPVRFLPVSAAPDGGSA